MNDRLTFSFDGEAVDAARGQSIAAALTACDVRVFRETAKGSPRGVFCGMGVCQDCLVTVNGVPNQRACMTLVGEGADVRRQAPKPELGVPARAENAPRNVRELRPEVLVIGAGAGGLNAASAAARAGARVLVLDERKVAGGQYYKQPAGAVPLLDAQQRAGAGLLAEALAAGAEIMSSVEIWAVFEGPVLYAVDGDGSPLVLRPVQLIVATGAYERPAMVPGWTRPGVMTTGAAQTLWRSYRTLPGRRVAVFGSGPLNLQVALELARGGADVRLVAEVAPSPFRRPGRGIDLVFAGPSLATAGLLNKQIAYRLGIIYRNERGDGAVEVDALCMNEGFEPQNEILRLLGTRLSYNAEFAHLRCERTARMETSVPGVYAVGDCCGLGGAPAAEAEGRIAGVAAAEACGYAISENIGEARSRLRRARRFQKALWALHDPSPRAAKTLTADTIVCRCEEIAVGDLRAAQEQGAGDIGALKRATRVGMGCCQGRYCGPVAARVNAAAGGQMPTDRGYFAPRVPIKPVSVAVIQATQEALETSEAQGTSAAAAQGPFGKTR